VVVCGNELLQDENDEDGVWVSRFGSRLVFKNRCFSAMVSSDHRMYRTSEVLGHQLDKLCLGPIHRDADFLNYNDFKNAWNTCVNMRDLEI